MSLFMAGKFMKIDKLILLAVAAIILLCRPILASVKNDDMYQEQPTATSSITFDGRGFIINGQRTFVASGDMHYSRIPQALWHDRLLRLKRSGLDCVQTYVFMDYHSPAEGVYDFSGEKDFNLYLKDIHDLGLYCTVRAGMYVCSEWDNGGYPEWLLLKPGLGLRITEPQFLAAHDSWYGQIMPIIHNNQINHGGSVILVQLDNEHPSCWGVDTQNQPYFTHLQTNALANGLEVPWWFSGLHHSHAPAGTVPFDSVGRTSPWYTSEFWAGWFNLYGGTVSEANTYDRNTWQIIAYGGNGYNYYMFHGGSSFDHWPSTDLGASYDYGAALGQAGDFRPLYYRDKRAALFARSFQAILENSTNASATYASAATGVSAISARGSPAGTILFLDNNTSGNSTATLNDGAQMTLEAGDIAPVVENFAMTSWLTIKEADARIFGIQPQGNLTTLVLYGLPGDTVRVGFTVTSGSVTYADPAFTTNAINPTNVTFSASIVDGTPTAYQLADGTNSLRILLMSKTAVDRTWFVDSLNTNYVVTGAAYVGEFTNANGQISASLEEPLGNSLPTNLLVFDGAQFAPRALSITNSISPGSPTAPTLVNWQMRFETNQAAVNYDDSAWFATNTAPLMGSDGDASHYAWYRAGVTVTNAGTYQLNFTGIRDWATLFVNGQQVPITASASAFSVPITLQAGTNILAIFVSQLGRDSLYAVTGTSSTGFNPRGLIGPVTLSASVGGSTSLTSWYWSNIGSSAPSTSAITTVTATNFNPVVAGWSTGSGWNGDVFNGTAGYAWFRTVLPTVSGTSHSIHFTNVDDNCTVYFNGTNIVATHNGWNQAFDVPLDSYWQTNGSNILTVLVQNTGGVGGLMGTVILNSLNPAATIPVWKLQGGVGTVDGTNVTWQPLASANGLPVFYRATFNYQPPSGVLPILRATWTGLSYGFMWLNGRNIGRYPDVIPAPGMYLPECWMGLGATNELVIFEEQGKAPSSMGLSVETATSRQLLQCTASVAAPTNLLAPTNLHVNSGNQQIALTWTASVGATNYIIWRGFSSGNESNSVGTTIGTTYTDAGLTNGTTYYYVVTATGSGGLVSSNSTEASATPAAPTVILPPASLNASPDNAQIALAWSASAGATNYTVWRGLSSGNETNSIGLTSGTTYVDTGLANGITYYYVVTAAGSIGVSSNSPEASATPVAPIGVQAPASLNAYPGNSQITLTWSASVGATNYVIWRGSVSGGEIDSVGTNTSTTYTDTGLANGTTYYYVVTAAGPGGVSGASPEASATPAVGVSGTWTADANGNWSDASNWFGSNVADGSGNTADFSTINLTADRIVTLDAPHTISTLNFGDTAPDHNWTLAGANTLTLGTTPVINVVNQNATISTVIAGTAFTKIGLGTLLLNGTTANTFAGTLSVNAGALTEDFSNLGTPVDLINNGVTLSMFGGTLNINGAGSGNTSQTFAGTALAAGGNMVSAIKNGNSTLVALKTLTVTKGATVNFSGTGTITTTTPGAAGLGVLGTRGNTASPAGYATVGLFDWASTDTTAGGTGSSPYTILPLSSVFGGYTNNYFPGTGQGAHTDLQANYTVGSNNTGTTTVRFNTPNANTLNVAGKWFVVAGILVTPNMGAVNSVIAGSGGGWFAYYSSSVAQDEVVWQNNTNGYLNVIEPLEDGRSNTAAPLTYIQAGAGTVVFSTANTYSGQSYLNGGTTVISANNNLGYPATASTLNLNGGTLVGNATFALDNGAGVNPRPVLLGNNGGGIAATIGNILTVDGAITSASGAGPLTIGIPATSANGNTAGLLPGTGNGTANSAVTATGTVLLSGSDTYTGNTILASGTLQLGATGSINNSPNIILGAGTTYDVSLVSGYTLNGGQTLFGNGTINGSVTASLGADVYGGMDGTYGTNTFNNDLTFAAGAATHFDVSTNNTGPNDEVVVNGNLTFNSTSIHIKAPSTSANLGEDYLLFTNGGILAANGGLSLVWDVPPANATNYSLQIFGKTVVLHYANISLPAVPVAGFTGTPTNVFVTQPVVFVDASTGSITNWLWNFGDGNGIANGSKASVTNTYLMAGKYTVSLTVAGAGGSSTNTQTGYIWAKPVPLLNGSMVSGNSLILSGTNGTQGVQYRVLMTTNMAMPMSAWTVLATNVFGPAGSYAYTNMSATNQAGFYKIVSP
jgi:beta-galactosidase